MLSLSTQEQGFYFHLFEFTLVSIRDILKSFLVLEYEIQENVHIFC